MQSPPRDVSLPQTQSKYSAIPKQTRRNRRYRRSTSTLLDSLDKLRRNYDLFVSSSMWFSPLIESSKGILSMLPARVNTQDVSTELIYTFLNLISYYNDGVLGKARVAPGQCKIYPQCEQSTHTIISSRNNNNNTNDNDQQSSNHTNDTTPLQRTPCLSLFNSNYLFLRSLYNKIRRTSTQKEFSKRYRRISSMNNIITLSSFVECFLELMSSKIFLYFNDTPLIDSTIASSSSSYVSQIITDWAPSWLSDVLVKVSPNVFGNQKDDNNSSSAPSSSTSLNQIMDVNSSNPFHRLQALRTQIMSMQQQHQQPQPSSSQQSLQLLSNTTITTTTPSNTASNIIIHPAPPTHPMEYPSTVLPPFALQARQRAVVKPGSPLYDTVTTTDADIFQSSSASSSSSIDNAIIPVSNPYLATPGNPTSQASTGLPVYDQPSNNDVIITSSNQYDATIQSYISTQNEINNIMTKNRYLYCFGIESIKFLCRMVILYNNYGEMNIPQNASDVALYYIDKNNRREISKYQYDQEALQEYSHNFTQWRDSQIMLHYSSSINNNNTNNDSPTTTTLVEKTKDTKSSNVSPITTSSSAFKYDITNKPQPPTLTSTYTGKLTNIPHPTVYKATHPLPSPPPSSSPQQRHNKPKHTTAKLSPDNRTINALKSLYLSVGRGAVPNGIWAQQLLLTYQDHYSYTPPPSSSSTTTDNSTKTSSSSSTTTDNDIYEIDHSSVTSLLPSSQQIELLRDYITGHHCDYLPSQRLLHDSSSSTPAATPGITPPDGTATGQQSPITTATLNGSLTSSTYIQTTTPLSRLPKWKRYLRILSEIIYWARPVLFTLSTYLTTHANSSGPSAIPTVISLACDALAYLTGPTSPLLRLSSSYGRHMSQLEMEQQQTWSARTSHYLSYLLQPYLFHHISLPILNKLKGLIHGFQSLTANIPLISTLVSLVVSLSDLLFSLLHLVQCHYFYWGSPAI